MPEIISPATTTRHFRFSGTYQFLWLCLAVAFYYNSYRYPLQINDSSTSPTYSDTPLILQLGKYFLFLGVCFWFFIRSHKFRLPERDSLLFVATACFVCFSLLLGFILSPRSAELAFLRPFECSIFLIIPLLSMGWGTRCPIDTIARPIWVFLWLSLLFLTLQVVLFITTGRLPALAYEESLTVRFGSIWDDPNSFPMMLALFVPMVLFRFTYITVAIITILIALLIIVLAQSITCAVSLAICFIAAFVLRFSDRLSISALAMKVYIILFVIFLPIAIVETEMLKAIFVGWQEEKAPSIAAHLIDFDRFDVLPFSFLGIAPTGVTGESGWLNLLLNQGILLTSLYAMFIITGIRQAAAAALHCSTQEKGLFYGAFCFQVAFAVSLFILPTNLVFPLNIINYILWSIVYIWRK
jgi:hypothetical protein